MKELKIIIKALPTSLNVMLGSHWAKRKKLKDNIIKLVQEQIDKHNLKMLDMDGKCIITITCFFKTKAHRDLDNFTFKEILDSIKGKIIIDDSYDYIEELKTRFRYDKENPRSEILIEYKEIQPKPKSLTEQLEYVKKSPHCTVCGSYHGLKDIVDTKTKVVEKICLECIFKKYSKRKDKDEEVLHNTVTNKFRRLT